MKYSLQTKYSLQNQVTITVSGPAHPPKVKYSQNFQMLHVPVTQRQVQVQTSMRSIPHPPRPAVRQPAAPTAHSSRTTTSSQREIFSETATEYDASSEASSRETSRPSSPESGNLTVRSVYSPLPEMAIVHKTMHNAIHAVRDQQGRAVTRRFLQEQQQLAASKLKCMSQIRKT